VTCGVCGYPLIPGITSCVQCGEPTDAAPFGIELGGPAIAPVSDSQVAAWVQENAAAREMARALTEARALEYAGDTGGAILIYERMVSAGSGYVPPYRRLAILYRKARNRIDEERVVRAALSYLTSGPNGWFIVRLAKILADKRQQGSG
jgi:hypothetical protein